MSEVRGGTGMKYKGAYWVKDRWCGGCLTIAVASETSWFPIARVGEYKDVFEERYKVVKKIKRPPKRS